MCEEMSIWIQQINYQCPPGVTTSHCTIGTLSSGMGALHNEVCRSLEDEEEIDSIQYLQRSRGKYLGDYFFEDLRNLQILKKI